MKTFHKALVCERDMNGEIITVRVTGRYFPNENIAKAIIGGKCFIKLLTGSEHSIRIETSPADSDS